MQKTKTTLHQGGFFYVTRICHNAESNENSPSKIEGQGEYENTEN